MLVKHSAEDSVSVIMPVYNAEKFIETSLQSVLRQSHSSFEVILINDGSTDATQKILNKYKNSKNVRLIERENRGIVATLNEAVSLSEGKYLMRMDADDISVPFRMETQLKVLKNDGLDIVGSAIKTFGGPYNHTRVKFSEDEKMKFQLLFASCFAHPTVFCKRHVLADHPYRAEWEKIEDYDLWTRLAAQGFRMGNCPEVLLNYRIHRKQITSFNRKFQDDQRALISQDYAEFFFKSDAYRKITGVLLGRAFTRLDKDDMSDLYEYYLFLKKNYAQFHDIFGYQFFLCFVHNYFRHSESRQLMRDWQFNNKKLVLLFNDLPFAKKLPAYLYQLIF